MKSLIPVIFLTLSLNACSKKQDPQPQPSPTPVILPPVPTATPLPSATPVPAGVWCETKIVAFSPCAGPSQLPKCHVGDKAEGWLTPKEGTVSGGACVQLVCKESCP